MTAATDALALKGMLCDPQNHFKGAYEVERKYRIIDIESLRSRLVEAGASAFMVNNTETDVYLDWPDGRLAIADKKLMLREMLPSQRVLWISKGPGPDQCVATDLPSFEAALQIHLSIGFVERFRYSKQRDIYFLGDFHWTLDSVSALGKFAEVAVMTDDLTSLPSWRVDIETEARKFGLSGDALVNTSYLEMLESRETE